MSGNFLGFDIGSNSVGWAVSDRLYNVEKFNKKSLWGIRLFDEANKAIDRRVFRSARRRKQRQKQRVEWLKDVFREEIEKVDEDFFDRLDESNLWYDDKTIKNKNSLFNEEKLDDQKFFRNFPTIYHLKEELIKSDKKQDIRFVYLALCHYMKNRGHFLIESDINNVEDINIKDLFSTINKCLEELGIDDETFCIKDVNKIKKIILDKNITGKQNKQKVFQEVLGKGRALNEIIKAITGGKANYKKLFSEENYDYDTIGLDKSFSFEEAKYEEELEEKLHTNLGDDFLIIDCIKQLYDFLILYKICKGEKYVSFAKVEAYKKHKEDLKFLKTFIKQNFDKETYKLIFKDEDKSLNNYASYLGNGGKKEEFYKFIKKIIESKKNTKEYKMIVNDIDNDNFLPRQRIKNNSVVPHQLYKNEIVRILENSSKHYSFLNKKSDGLLNIEKLIKIFEFKIPYYIGPLNNQHKAKEDGFSWIVRKQGVKITPWNFYKVINAAETAEKFITNMTNNCTYLKNEKVIAKCTLLYSKYDLLNEINKLKINDNPISVELKEKTIKELFKTQKTVSYNALKKFLVKEGLFEKVKDINLSGVDTELKGFKASLSSYIDFKNIIGKEIDNHKIQQAVEDIVMWITLFTDKKILKSKITNTYNNIFTKEQINAMCNLNYTGWGRFSKKFLTEIRTDKIVNKQTGETNLSIIDILECKNKNLMEIINDIDMGIQEQLEKSYFPLIKENIIYKDIDELYCSPAVKKQIWQTVLVAKDLKKVLSEDPEKIFIEMARGEGDKIRTLSRKKRLQKIYEEAIKKNVEYKQQLVEMKTILEAKDDDKFKIKKLYHYFMQMGRCVYSNEAIDLDELLNDKYNNKYDIDHIYPQSKVKDDSINNTVLVKRIANALKTDDYPIKPEIQNKCKSLWVMLRKNGLISKEKYNRLVRKEPLTSEEKMHFVARQLVETRQTTKEVGKLLESIFPNSKIVYSKAENVSLFKQYFSKPTKRSVELGKVDKNKIWDDALVKCREVNDLHHAKDAYLNIVVGNVYDTKFGKYFYKNKKKSKEYKNYNKFGCKEERLEYFNKQHYHLRKMYKYNTDDAWIKDDNKTILNVIKYMNRNDILFTKESKFKKGQFWAQNAVKKQANLIPIKKELSNTLKYGGYNITKPSYFVVVEYENKKGLRERKFETVPVYLLNDIKKDNQALIKYFENKLNLKEPKIIIDKIKMGSLIKLDDKYVFIAGNSGNKILVNIASQLILPKEMVAYVKKLVKYKDKLTKYRNNKEILEIIKKQTENFDKDKNLELYELYISKLLKKEYSIIPSLQDKLISYKDKFISLNINEQVLCLLNILPAFQANGQNADLSSLGGGKTIGKIQPTKIAVFNNYKNITIIDYSITGIYKKIRKIK